jgi:multidrug transporter EmrE-like cation transporter
MDKLFSLGFIFLTILLGLYGQVVLKWQVDLAGPPPADWASRLDYIVGLLRSPWVWSTLAAAFLGMLSWMLALSHTELSYAYPFTSLSFVLILLASSAFFSEPITPSKLAGMALIVVGIVVGSR